MRIKVKKVWVTKKNFDVFNLSSLKSYEENGFFIAIEISLIDFYRQTILSNLSQISKNFPKFCLKILGRK